MSAVERQGQLMGFMVSTDADLVEKVRQGIPSIRIQKFVDLGYDRSEIIKLVGASSTVERKIKDHAKLSKTESDRLARVARVVALAERMFGNKEKARKWLERPSRQLETDLPPIKMLDTDHGTKLVEERLYQIGYGMFA